MFKNEKSNEKKSLFQMTHPQMSDSSELNRPSQILFVKSIMQKLEHTKFK